MKNKQITFKEYYSDERSELAHLILGKNGMIFWAILYLVFILPPWGLLYELAVVRSFVDVSSYVWPRFSHMRSYTGNFAEHALVTVALQNALGLVFLVHSVFRGYLDIDERRLDKSDVSIWYCLKFITMYWAFSLATVFVAANFTHFELAIYSRINENKYLYVAFSLLLWFVVYVFAYAGAAFLKVLVYVHGKNWWERGR